MIGKVASVELPDGREYDFAYTSGKLTSITEDFNDVSYTDRTWSFDYTSGKLDSVTYPSGTATYGLGYGQRLFTYSGNKIASEVDLEGKAWAFTYDGSNRLLTFENPDNDTFTYAYSSGTTTMEMPLGETSSHTYTSDLLVLTQDAASFGNGYSYNSQRQVTVKTDKDSNNWGYDYDTDGNLIHVLDPVAANTWDYTYNANNDLTSATTPLGNEKVIVYDGLLLDRIEQEVGVSDWRITEVTQNVDGTIDKVIDERGMETSFTYDSCGNLTRITDPATVETNFGYDAAGRRKSVGLGTSDTAKTTYDSWSRPILIEHPDVVPGTSDTTTVSIQYNDESYPTTITNELSKSITALYDANYRFENILAGTAPVGLKYCYNFNGWVEEVKQHTSGGLVSKYTLDYNVRGEVIEMLLHGHTIGEEWSYTGSGQIGTYSSPSGTYASSSYYNIDYTYDGRNQLTYVDYPSGTSDVAFTYDDDGRQTDMVDSTGTTSYEYNRADDVIAFRPPSGIDVEYQYNSVGEVDKIIDDASNTGFTKEYNYGYEALTDRLETITNPYSEVTTFGYDSLGRVHEKLFSAGHKEVIEYDGRHRPKSVSLQDGSTVIRKQSYVLDAASRVEQFKLGDATVTPLEVVDYEYEDDGSIKKETHAGGPTIEYTYDLSGNRLTRKVGASTDYYIYDSNHEDLLVQVTDGSSVLKSFTYDNANRRITQTVGSNTTSYGYDHAGRLTGITYPSASTDSFGYNGLDTRLSKTEGSTTTTYNRAGSYVTDPVLSDSGARYTPGISERRGSTTTFSHPGLKNENTQTNTSKAVTATRTYDAFGQELASTGTWQSPFGYAGAMGYQSGDRSGLMLLGHRYYDPGTGKFITSDPIKSGDNWFNYCGNNPLSKADPLGLWATGSYWGDVWEVFKGYGDAINPVNWYHGIVRVLDVCADQGPFAAIAEIGKGLWHSIALWEAEDGRDFGGRFGSVLLTATPIAASKLCGRVAVVAESTAATRSPILARVAEQAPVIENGHNGLPMTGPSNGVGLRFNERGLDQIRLWKEDGGPIVDIDSGHATHHHDPHYHLWDGTERGPAIFFK